MIKELSFPGLFRFSHTQSARTHFIKRENFGKKIWVAALLIVNTALLFMYILGVNNYASTGFEIKSLQNIINQIDQENRKLTLQISERTSVASLQQELMGSGFVAVKQNLYLQQQQFSQK